MDDAIGDADTIPVRAPTVSSPFRRRTSAPRSRLRGWLRAAHRDAGYLAVGLTFVYALSGLAVNHMGDWDPNSVHTEEVHRLRGGLPEDPSAAARVVLAQIGLSDPRADAYAAPDGRLEIELQDGGAVHVDRTRREAVHEGKRDRFLLRTANWLHLNRGKKAWTWIADGYAGLLLLLATSGVFMLPGRKGLFGRGGLFVGLGAAVPILYVVLSRA